MTASLILKNWQVRKRIINFLLYKYNQNETALKLQPASLLYQRRKVALEELIVLDMRKNGVHR